MLEEWFSYLEGIRGVSPHTLRNYRIDLTAFFEFVQGKECSVLAVDREMIRDFFAEQREKGLQKKTVARRLSALRTFFRFCVSQGRVKESPVEKMSHPRLEKKIPSVLTYAQVECLLTQPDLSSFAGVRDRAILELFYSSGLRVSELTGLNHGDLDSKNLWLRIRGKGRKQRDVPLTPIAASWMEKYRNHPEYPLSFTGVDPIFLNRFGTRLTPRSVDRLFKKYLVQSGLAGSVTPHTIRHTVATHWLEEDMNIKVIQELLGHASPATTTLYTQVSPTLQKKKHEEFHPRAFVELL